MFLSTKYRDSYFDNLKGLAILCVVIGNSLEHVNPTKVNPHYLILMFYMFHMPLITFVSGYLSEKSSRTTQQKVTDTIKLYLFAQIFYFIFNRFILHRSSVKFQLFYPSWTLWYLLALTGWYIISDYITNYKIAIPVSILISLIIGFDTCVNSYASFSRIFFFLPFFILGMAFNKNVFLEKVQKHKIIILLAALLTTLAVYIVRDIIDVSMLFEYAYYSFFDVSSIIVLLVRVFHYLGAFILGIFLLTITTSRKTILSWLGKNSLIIYISHAAVIELLTKTHVLKYNTWFQLIISEAIIVLSVCMFTYIFIFLKTYMQKNLKSYKNAVNIDL